MNNFLDQRKTGGGAVFAMQVYTPSVPLLGGLGSVQGNYPSTGRLYKASIHAAPRDCTFHFQASSETELIAWD